MKNLTDQEIRDAAEDFALVFKDVKAVTQVEAKGRGFDDNDLPLILFEAHKFRSFTNCRYDATNPTISAPYPDSRRFYSKGATSTDINTKEHARLGEATALDREAGLKSASWGLFQIMGFNHVAAGFPNIQDFINAMFENEAAQLRAFLSFIKNDSGGRMLKALREHRWADFARWYNGPDYAAGKYDIKLGKAWSEV